MSKMHNSTVDNGDTGQWALADWPGDAPLVQQSGNLTFSNDLSATFMFAVPGIQICVDCDPGHPKWQDIDAVRRVDDEKQPPVVLFSQTFDTLGSHAIIVRNQAESRVGDNSQITIDRLELLIECKNPTSSSSTKQPSATPTPLISIEASSMPMTTISSPISTARIADYDTSAGGSATSLGTTGRSTSIANFVEGMVGGVFAGVGAVLLFLWIKRRKAIFRNERLPSFFQGAPFISRSLASLPLAPGIIEKYHDEPPAQSSQQHPMYHQYQATRSPKILPSKRLKISRTKSEIPGQAFTGNFKSAQEDRKNDKRVPPLSEPSFTSYINTQGSNLSDRSSTITRGSSYFRRS